LLVAACAPLLKICVVEETLILQDGGEASKATANQARIAALTANLKTWHTRIYIR
jgi:hypothetical protein